MQSQPGHQSLIQETELKICDLCGGLNLESNEECFVCGWRGRFLRNSDMVRAAVDLTVRRFGRLELQHVTDTRRLANVPRARHLLPGWLRAFLRWLAQ